MCRHASSIESNNNLRDKDKNYVIGLCTTLLQICIYVSTVVSSSNA